MNRWKNDTFKKLPQWKLRIYWELTLNINIMWKDSKQSLGINIKQNCNGDSDTPVKMIKSAYDFPKKLLKETPRSTEKCV